VIAQGRNGRNNCVILVLAALAILPPGAPAQGPIGTTQATVQNPPLNASLKQRQEIYHIHPGDILDIKFSFASDFDQTVTVQPDGDINILSLGAIRSAGHSVPELRHILTEAYASILQNAELTVDLKSFEQPYFVVAGQVAKPGKYELRSDTTLVTAVAVAGGFTDAAKNSQVLVFHNEHGGLVETRVVNMKTLTTRAHIGEDLTLRAGDTIFVPQSRASKIRRYIPSSSMGMYVNPNPF
jgi:polysaccharide export outer membrane protein